uniref:Ig-like domain-containing protein n=1 Tax=Latimeria chalumnae TaxID=7897 RepID=H2ZUH1_LATCH
LSHTHTAMAFLSAFTLLLLSLAGVQSAVVLTQSAEEIKKPGDSFRVSCKTSGFSLTSYGVGWIRQPIGKGLEWLAIIFWNANTRYSSSIQGRFTISRDTSSSTVYLQMNNLKVEDTAMYYCAR